MGSFERYQYRLRIGKRWRKEIEIHGHSMPLEQRQRRAASEVEISFAERC
jgi:hypothetical protein